MKKLKLGRRILLMMQSPFTLGLLISSFSYLLNPAEYPWAGVAGLSFPFFLLMQCIFTSLWILRLSKVAPWSIGATLLLALPHLSGMFQFSGSSIESGSMGSIQVMSYNVHFWRPVDSAPDGATADSMINTVENINPDIFIAQEYRPLDNEHPLRYPHISYFKNKGQSFGLAIFSKFKIVDSGQELFEHSRSSYNAFTWADVEFQGTVIRVVNVQLVNTRLVPESYQSLGGNIGTEIDSDQLEEESKDIYNRLTESYKIRGEQAAQLANFLAQSPHKIILAGDFNDTPSSFSYSTIKGEMQDSFAEAGKGTGDTYNKMRLIPLRIDYLFASPEFAIGDYRTVQVHWSDHKPITAQFALPAQ